MPEGYSVQELKKYAKQLAAEVGIDFNIFERQINQESGWQHYNPNGTIKTSPAGAKGVAQIMPQYHNVDWSDPFVSIEYAINHMKQLLDMFGGDYSLALAAYNAGAGTVEEYGGIPPFDETKTYIRNILGDYDMAGPEDEKDLEPTTKKKPPKTPVTGENTPASPFIPKGYEFLFDKPLGSTILRSLIEGGFNPALLRLPWMRKMLDRLTSYTELEQVANPEFDLGNFIQTGGLSGAYDKGTLVDLRTRLMDQLGGGEFGGFSQLLAENPENISALAATYGTNPVFAGLLGRFLESTIAPQIGAYGEEFVPDQFGDVGAALRRLLGLGLSQSSGGFDPNISPRTMGLRGWGAPM